MRVTTSGRQSITDDIGRSVKVLFFYFFYVFGPHAFLILECLILAVYVFDFKSHMYLKSYTAFLCVFLSYVGLTLVFDSYICV